MADDVSTGEIVRRLDRFEGRLDGFETLLRDLRLLVVSQEVYARDRSETERRFAAGERDLEQEVADRKAGDEKAHERIDKDRSNTRQTILGGYLPAVLFMLGTAVNLLLAFRGS